LTEAPEDLTQTKARLDLIVIPIVLAEVAATHRRLTAGARA
jgi:hypothetical protein